MFPENVRFEFVLLHLEEEMGAYVPPVAQPLPCDRWIARSCLQKAIRRGETDIAQRALASLLEQDRYGVWRHLVVIALEDVGAPGIATIARVVAAGRNRQWRKSIGGEWAVASFLVRRMAEGLHCQAACDLLLKAMNCPSFVDVREDVFAAGSAAVLRQLSNPDAPLEEQGAAALALAGLWGGRLTQEGGGAVFDSLARRGGSSEEVETCRAAWTSTRNPMALLLPLVWKRWSKQVGTICDDPMSRGTFIADVPDYSIDQFTRVGGQVARAYLAGDRDMCAILDGANIARPQQARVVGDLLFLIEGGLLKARLVWPTGDRLRLPVRMLPGAVKLGSALPAAVAQLRSNAALTAQLRTQYLHQLKA